MQDQTLHRIIEAPIRLGYNPVQRPNRGGLAVQAFRSLPAPIESDRPEDWVGSVGSAPRRDGRLEGVSEIEVQGVGRTSLKQLVERYPEEMVGAGVAQRLGATPGVLIKLLSTAQRVPLRAVPSVAFAQRHLGGSGGGPLGWVVLAAPGWRGPAHVWVGFRQHVTARWFADAVVRQDAGLLQDSVHRLQVRPGDALLVGPGVPHAIGPGVFLVELRVVPEQEIVAEWRGFAREEQEATLNLGWQPALRAFDYTATSATLADGMVRQLPRVQREGQGGQETRLFEPRAAGAFGATRLDVTGELVIEAGRFCVEFVLDGDGFIEGEFGRETLRRGDTYACAAALAHRLRAGTSPLRVLRCHGPDA